MLLHRAQHSGRQVCLGFLSLAVYMRIYRQRHHVYISLHYFSEVPLSEKRRKLQSKDLILKKGFGRTCNDQISLLVLSCLQGVLFFCDCELLFLI